MAKNVGLIGGLRGKLGNAVFYIQNGVQVARVYQPIVSNPSTLGQRTQRAKFDLAGRLSKITPIEGLAGFEGAPRFKRAKFVRAAVKAASFANNLASLNANDLRLSDGVYPILSSPSYTVTLANDFIRVNIASTLLSQASIPAGYAETYVVYMINPTTSQADFCNVVTRAYGSGTEISATVRQTIPHGTAANYQVFVYAVPSNLEEALTGVDYSYLGATTPNYELSAQNILESGRVFGSSSLVAAPASKGDDPEEVETRKKK